MSTQLSDSSSASLFARSQKIVPGGVHSPVRSFKSVGGTPLYFASAEGACLTSVEGQEYIDFCQSFGPLILGHRDPEVQAAVEEQIRKVWTLGACESYSLELAELMVEGIPWAEKIRFVNSGTEAVMSALRVARAATGRNKILKFTGCYHGHADSLLVKAGSGLAGSCASDSAGVPQGVIADTLVTELDDEAALERVFAEQGQDIAAVIVEPLPANFGLLLQRVDYLKFMAELAKKHGALLIFDEVISGFRVAWGGMAEVLGMTPDLVTYGKIIGGGFPVGAYAGRADLMDLVAPSGPVYQAGTLSANPVGMVAGLASLKKLRSGEFYNELNGRAEGFISKVRSMIERHGVDLEVVRSHSLFWFHKKTGSPLRRIDHLPAEQAEGFKGLFQALLRQGVYLAPSAYEVGFLSAAHDPKVLDQTLEKLDRALAELG